MKKRSVYSGFLSLVMIMFLGVINPAVVFAHNVAQVQTAIYMAPETVQMLKDRVASGGSPGLIVGDVYSYIVQFTPVPNNGTIGAGGYVTYYVPSGSQVVGVLMVDKNSSGEFEQIAPSLPGVTPDGWGSRGREVFSKSPWTTAFDALCTLFAQPLGQCNGSLAQHFADTGIFYSTDSRTALYVSPDTDGIIRQGTNGYNVTSVRAFQVNNILEQSQATTHNLWDANSTNNWGSTQSAINATPSPKSSETTTNSSGQGTIAFNAASPVAGSDSGYQLDYTGSIGPWHRIYYPGSRVGSNTIGPATSSSGSGGQAGSSATIVGSDTVSGYAISEANPLPSGTNAIRFSIGNLQVGQIKYVKVTLKVTLAPPASGIIHNSEVFGGDVASAAGVIARDNAWVYHVPSIAYGNSNMYIYKEIVEVNGVSYYNGPVPVNAILRYRLTYLNTGAVTQTNVVLSDTLPSETGADSVSNLAVISGPNILPISPASPAAGGTFTFQTIASLAPGYGGSVEYDVQTASVAGNIVSNKASVTSDQIIVPISVYAVALVNNTALLYVDKQVTPDTSEAGDTETYTLNITNIGTAATSTLSSLVVKDYLPTSGGAGSTTRFNFVTGSSVFSGISSVTPTVVSPPTTVPFSSQNRQQVSWNFGAQSIAVGQSFSISYQATIGSAVPASVNPYLNDVSVNYHNGSATLDSTNYNAAPVVVTAESADLSLTKSASAPVVIVGDPFTYTITVSNSGPNDATNVSVADVLPAGVTLLYSSATQGLYSPNTWTIGTIASGASKTLTVTVQANSGTEGSTITNMAQVKSSNQLDPDSTPNNSVALEDDQDSVDVSVATQVADLSLTKIVDDSTPNVGDTIVYTITVTNAGSDSATNVTVGDILPAGLTFVSSNPSQGSYAADVWTIGTIANGASKTLGITATVNAGTGGTIITNTAQVKSSDQADPDSTPDNSNAAEDDQDSQDIDVQQADLSVVKIVNNATPSEGDTITYTITVTNSGPDSATNVTVGDIFPAGITYVSDNPSQGNYAANVWTIGTIANGASKTLGITATVNAGTGGSTITNTATVTASDQADPDIDDLSDDADITVNEESADLSLTKTVDDSTPNVGDTIVYTITVTNSGPDSATNVTVGDILPAGLTYVSDNPSQGSYAANVWTIGTIANGASKTLGITATVNAGTGGTIITNTAQVKSSDQADPDSTPDNSNAAEDDQDSQDIDVQQADLSLVKTVDDITPDEGDTIVYTITVTNSGPDSATNVAVGDVLPAGLTFVSSNPSQGNYAANVWTIGTIANGASKTLGITATVNVGTGGSTITNTATVTASDQADPDSDDLSDDADIMVDEQIADLSLTKTVDDSTPNVGDTIIYTITVTNAGPDSATNVTVGDILPAGLTFVSSNPSQGSYAANVWTIGTIANGASKTLGITATVNAGTGGTIITNTAQVKSSDQVDPDSTPDNSNAAEDDQDSQNIDVQQADLSVVKMVDNATPSEGDTIVYTITVTNSGPDSATNVTVGDILPAGITYVSDNPSQGNYAANVWTIGTIANGASKTLGITATVNVGTNGTTITNTASISTTDQEDPDPGDDSDSADVDVQQADLSLTKTVDDPTPNAGNTITYTITVTNSGPDSATNVTVGDILSAGLTFVSSNPSQGNYAANVWTIGTIANGASKTLGITATVNAGTGGSTITNTAQVKFSDQTDPDSTPNNSNAAEDDQDSVSFTVQSADLSLTKTVDNPMPEEGDTIVYTIIVTNSGPDSATSVTVGDVLPSELTYVSDNPGQGSYAANVWTIGTIANGASKTLQITATVNAGTGESVITNVASIATTDQDDPDINDWSDDADVTVNEQSADLSLVKTVDDPTPNEGDTIVYTITVTNSGPDSATNVTVGDILPAGLTFVSSNPSQGNYAANVWTIGIIANGASETLGITATVNAGTGGTIIINTASVTSTDQEDPDPGDELDSADIDVQQADLSIVKTVDDATPSEGDTIVYTITVTNSGPDSATNVTVGDLLPAGITYVSDNPSQGSYAANVWTIGTIANGASKTLGITATVDAGTGGSTITNTATVTASDQADPDTDDLSDDADITVNEQSADLSLTKTVDDSTPNVRDTIIYTITVTNSGPDSATNVTVGDILPAGLTYVSDNPSQGSYAANVWTIGTIANGVSKTLGITATVNAGTGGTIITNTAQVKSSDQADPDSTPDNSNAVEDDQDSQDIDVQQADLSLTKTVDDVTPDEGDTIVYTITVTNSGPDSATNVTVGDLLPAGITYVSDNPSQGSYAANVWTIGTIANGASKTLGITATVNSGTAGTTITNTATVNTSDQVDPDTDDLSDDADITVNEQSADLSLTKTVNDSTPNEGDTIVYIITVTNSGPDSATNVTVGDLLPAGITYVSDNPSQGSYAANVWTIGTIANGASKTLGITATVNAGTGGTIITNTASIATTDQPDPDPGDDQDSQDIDVQQADLSIVKTVDDATPDEGDTIVYTITVTNSGPDSATNVTVGDLLPAGITYVSDNPSQGSYAANVWTIGTIANGASKTLGITATVNAGIAGTTITNTATVNTSDQADPDTDDLSDDADITVALGTADLSLTKTVDENSPHEGDTVTYTLTITNSGPDNATNVVVEDVLPIGVTYSSSVPSAGLYAANTWSISSLLNGASATLQLVVTVDPGTASTAITNTAQVDSADQNDPDSTPGNDNAGEDDQASVTLNVLEYVADLSLTKIVDNTVPVEGDDVTYTITVSNAGPDAANGVTVQDILPVGLSLVSSTPSQGTYVGNTWTVGTIAVSANATLQITVTVDSDAGGSTITNTAQVKNSDQADPDSTPNNGNVAEDDQDFVDINVQEAPIADLSLTKIVNDQFPNEGDTIMFTVSVVNAGPQDATGVTVQDVVPAGLTFVSATPSVGNYAGNTWTIGTINAGQTVTMTLEATVDAGTLGDMISNTAEVTNSDQADPDSTPGNDVEAEDDQETVGIEVTAAPPTTIDLELEKTVDNDTPSVGDTLIYTVTIQNNGAVEATNVQVQDVLSSDLTFVSATPSNGLFAADVWTIASIMPAASETLQIAVTVGADAEGNTIINTAEVVAADQTDIDSTPANANLGEDDIASVNIDVDEVFATDIGVSKNVSNNLPGEGDTITYTIGVTNNGPDIATSLILTDVLPAGVIYVSDLSGQGLYNPATGQWVVGTLDVLDSATLEIVVTVDAGTANTTITNTVVLAGLDQTDTNAGNNSDDSLIEVQEVDAVIDTDMAVTKEVSDSTPAVGNAITYTIMVTNNGPASGTNVGYIDLLPDGVTFVSSNPSQGIYNPVTGQWAIGSLSVADSATLEIVVTVNNGTWGNTVTNSVALFELDQTDTNVDNDSDSVAITVESGGGGGGGCTSNCGGVPPSPPAPVNEEPAPSLPLGTQEEVVAPSCLAYTSKRELVFNDMSGEKDIFKTIANILKGTYLVEAGYKGQKQYVLGGYSSFTNDTGAHRIELGNNITRLEWAKTLMTSHCLKIYDATVLSSKTMFGNDMSEFKDLPKVHTGDAVNDWYVDVMYSAQYYEILDGTLQTNAEPGRFINVAEAMKMIMRAGQAIGMVPKKAFQQLSPGEKWYMKYYSQAASEGILVKPLGVDLNLQVQSNLRRKNAVALLLKAIIERKLYMDSSEKMVRNELNM